MMSEPKQNVCAHFTKRGCNINGNYIVNARAEFTSLLIYGDIYIYKRSSLVVFVDNMIF